MDYLFGPSWPYFEGPWTWDRKGYDQARRNFIDIHGHEPHPLHNAYRLYDLYRKPQGPLAIMLMNAAQLADLTADLGARIEAAKAKNRIA